MRGIFNKNRSVSLIIIENDKNMRDWIKKVFLLTKHKTIKL